MAPLAAFIGMSQPSKESQLPPKDAVRTEELINYFDDAYPQPRDRAQPLALVT